MRHFLETLSRGASKPNAKCKEALRILEFLKAISFHKGKAYLNNGFITGRLDINARGVGFIEVFSEGPMRDIVVESKNLGGAHLGDIVVAHLLSNKKSRQSAKILAVLEPANETSLVYLKRFGEAVLGVNIQNGLSLALKASQKSLKALPLGTLLKINNANNEITEVLGLITDPNIDEKISLAIYNKKDEFSPACQDEARAWGDVVDPSMYKERVDLQHLPFCTIDPDDAKDFDDAIYYDTSKNALYIAIADVSEYVSAFSATDKEAKNRCFSIYFPHKSVPM
ncbi:MAG: RNB domain-containing ribonuclease, partial [Campylobacter sp.]|nr:RNB domain-containing ribonuclease [Campylobacter sp.]